MRYHSSAASIALAVVAVLGLAGPAAAEQIRFRGRLEGDVTRTPLVPPYAFVLVESTGEATELGEFTLDIPHLVNTETRTAIGFYEFTAANGDTLSAIFTGRATPTPEGLLSIVEIATITGGTGRFARARGHFTCERLFDPIAGTTTGSFHGTIRLRDD